MKILKLAICFLAMATGAANVMESGTQAAERSVVDGLVDQVKVTRLA